MMSTASGPASEHPLYTEALPDWTLCRDVHAGARVVKAKGKVYLPAPPPVKSLPDWYGRFLDSAPFYGVLGRTESALRGSVFASPPEVDAPGSVLDQVSPAALELLAARLTTDLLLTGRAVIELAVDPDAGRIVWLQHEAESLINWTPGERFVFKVETFEPTADGWGRERRQRIRVVRRAGGGVVVDVYVQPGGKRDWVLETSTPVVWAGRPFESLPVFVTGIERNDLVPDRSPLYDVAQLNVAHYRLSALHQLGLMLTSLPTPWVSGVSGPVETGVPQYRSGPTNTPRLISEIPKPGGLVMGGASVWRLPKDAAAGMLEFSGRGLKAQLDGLTALEQRMAAIGARVLMSPKRAAETAEATRLKAAGDVSVLHSLATSLDALMERGLSMHATAIGASGKVGYKLNKDFLDAKIQPDEIRVLLDAYDARVINRDTLIERLVSGGAIPPLAEGDGGTTPEGE